MATLDELVEGFYGSDPVRGEEARIEILKNYRDKAIEALIPLDVVPYSLSIQVNERLKLVAAELGPEIVPYLSRAISSGSWNAKQRAAVCFAGLESSEETYGPLISLLQGEESIDAHRLAIQALGFLGARDWAYHIEKFVRHGIWRYEKAYFLEEVSEYNFEKLSSYALETLTRFAAKCTDKIDRSNSFDLLTAFIEFRQAQLPHHGRSAYEQVADLAPQFTQFSVDHLIDMWGRSSNERLQVLCMEVLGAIAPLRAARYLLETAVNPSVSDSIRRQASIALGEIRHVQAARLLANAMANPSTDRTQLAYAFSTLYALPADWPDLSDYIEDILSEENEPATQLRYSLALKGDNHCQAQLLELLDDHRSYLRWPAALTLARFLGPESRPYLEYRAEESSDPVERCAMYAALVYAGDESKVQSLREALQATPSLPNLRTVWKVEILDSLRAVDNFDKKAFNLWLMASQISRRQLQYFDSILLSLNQTSNNTPSANVPDTRSGQPEVFGTGVPDQSPPVEPQSSQTKLFISYSRRDGEWLKQFQDMLSPLIRSERIDLWDDTKIQPGKWRPQIDEAMKNSHVALFLVSVKFLASDFIMEHELPDLLQYAEERDVTILWVLLDECLWEDSDIAEYQGENAGRPLSLMSKGEANQIIKNTCVKIRKLLSD